MYFVCCWLPVIMWFLFGEVPSSSGCLGWATLFYRGTPLNIIIGLPCSDKIKCIQPFKPVLLMIFKNLSKI